MLHFFRINDPYRLFGLLVLLTVLSLFIFIDSPGITHPELKSILIGEKVTEGYSLYSEIIDSTPPLASWFYGLCDWIFGRNLTARHLFTFVLLFLQSAFLGIILIDKRAYNENTFIPSLIFSLLMLISFDMLSLTAEVAASGIMLLALNALLTEIEFRVQRDETIFNLGLFISLASLFSISYIIYLPGLLVILIIFTRNTIRKYLLMGMGFILPYLLVFCLFYLNNNHYELWNRFVVPNLAFTTAPFLSFKSLITLCAVPLLYLLISILVLNRNAHLTKYQSQVLQAMFLWMVIALIQILFAPGLRPQSLLPLAPPVCFLITHFLLAIRRKKIAEINTWVILLGIISTLYFSSYQKISYVDNSKLLVGLSSVEFSDKKTLVLDNNPGAYIHNTLSPAFINWNLSADIFDNSQYYENVLLVNRLFEKDSPEIILDPDNRMEKFFERIPGLKSKYKRSGNGTWMLISN